MKPGTVLVCTTTTPAQVPLFSQVTGLVTDIGGALAHGSIVARKHGIPVVMGTGNATQRITNGQRIVVDGDAGSVLLVEEDGAGVGVQPMEEPTASNVRTKIMLVVVAGVIGGLMARWVQRRQRSAKHAAGYHEM